MQRNTTATEPLVSISAAARKLGLNPSTLSRQAKRGQIRVHDGMVRLSEVVEDRSQRVQLRRSRRAKGIPDHASVVASPIVAVQPNATPGALNASPDASIVRRPWHVAEEAMIHLLRNLRVKIAGRLVDAKAPMAIVDCATSMIFMETLDLAGAALASIGLSGFDYASDEEDAGWALEDIAKQVRGGIEPDWAALAAQAGEPVDHAAWDDYRNSLPWWQDEEIACG